MAVLVTLNKIICVLSDFFLLSGVRRMAKVDHERQRYPACIVWTPIPCLTWLFPIIGHMGIATTEGVIRDFAGPYYVSEDDMAFGAPTKYWSLDPELAAEGSGGAAVYDRAVAEASEVYKGRMHNLCCDNCHSHVARALNTMKYQDSTNWNMVTLAILMLVHGKYVSWGAAVKTWLPFIILAVIITVIILSTHLT